MRRLLYPLLLIHWFRYRFSNINTRHLIDKDIDYMNARCSDNKGLLYYLTYHKPYRNVFYYRIGGSCHLLKLVARPYSLFEVHADSIGPGVFVINHPFSTIINAKSIGSHFTICHLTTIGNAIHGRNDLVPTIGDNVTLGANVTIIGDIRIGDNVVVGAGSVVVKDVPSNTIVAGNPAKVIKFIE